MEQQKNDPANSPAPVTQPQPAPVPQPTPANTPTAAPPQPGTPGSAPAGSVAPVKKSKIPLIIFIVLGLIVAGFVVVVVYNSVSKLRSNKPTTEGTVSTSVVSTNSSANTCGVKLEKENENDEKGHITYERYPKGFQMWDIGGDDSIREYCEGAKFKEQAEGFIAALSDNNWDKAYTYLAKNETSVPLAKKKADWTAEYGSYDFPPTNWPYYDADGATTDYPRYVIEPCRKDYNQGWSKEMKSGYYETPFLMLDRAKGVSTKIFLLMNLEEGTWKVAGENNKLHNASGIVLDGDAYSNAQNDREYTNPYKCGQ